MSGRGKKFLALGVAVVLCLAAAAAMGSLFHWKVTCTPAAFAESSRSCLLYTSDAADE